jgi:hypothetical protein
MTTASAQYSMIGSGQGKNGTYRLKVSTTVKDVKSGKEVLKRYAVHGVLFKGFAYEEEGIARQKPLVNDPNIESEKASFFNAFFSEKKHEQYVTIVNTSYTSIKVKGGYEVSGLILVDKEKLLNYLEESGVVKGLSNLW